MLSHANRRHVFVFMAWRLSQFCLTTGCHLLLCFYAETTAEPDPMGNLIVMASRQKMAVDKLYNI